MSSTFYIILILAVLFAMYLNGRVKSRRDLATAGGVIVVAGVWLAHVQAKADEDARAKVTALFRLGAGAEIVEFSRSGSRGSPTQDIEAIVRFSPESFKAYRGQALAPLGTISFNYPTGMMNSRPIDKFNVSGDALAWNALPRTRPGAKGFFPQRGPASQRWTPDDRNMSGSYVCAFIPVEPEGAKSSDSYDLIPCNSVSQHNPEGITILGTLYEHDLTLHALIE